MIRFPLREGSTPEQQNQWFLEHAIAALCEHVRVGQSGDELRDAQVEFANAMTAPPALERVREIFDLSPFERDVLLFCVAAALDPQQLMEAMGAAGASRQRPSFGSILSLLPQPHWSACSVERPLRQFGLVRFETPDALLESAFHVEDDLLNYLKGVRATHSQILARSFPLPPVERPSAGMVSALERVGALWALERSPCVQLTGREADTRGAARILADWRCAPARAVRASDLRAANENDWAFARLVEREARLGLITPVVEIDEPATERSLASLRYLVSSADLRGILLVAREAVPVDTTDRVTVMVDSATLDERRSHWRQLDPRGTLEDVAMDRLAGQFRLPADRLLGVAADTGLLEGVAEFSDIWAACVEASVSSMRGLAQRVEGAPHRDALILPDRQNVALDALIAQAKHRHAMTRGDLGRTEGGGMIGLFSGPSGTGKTMAATILGRELGLPVFRIDLSAIVSKYIGETEKHLSRIFDAAEEGGGILLFDEADALFGKRTAVDSSHDRHANIEVSYLLQRIEAYSGIAILTTNNESDIDSAFLRRIRSVVRFAAPGEEERRELWQRALARLRCSDGVGLEELASVPFTGAEIRNVEMLAVSLAIECDREVDAADLRSAVRVEFEKNHPHEPLPRQLRKLMR